ncbi:MAG: hypothetical protein H6730_11125 [Deltaproteobacteria bacterium]|nr:hypothetical protein [Deltaproteobacteria bacterium]
MRPSLALCLGLVAACGEGTPAGPPPCGSFENGLVTLIPGPGQAGYDEALADAARKHDRLFVALFSRATGLNADFQVTDNDPAARAQVTRFVTEDDGWDFEAAVGVTPESLGVWQKSAGLYAGVGVAADAYRYGVLRDSGAACAEVAVARAQLVRGLEGVDLAARITGVPGVNARSLVNLAFPSPGYPEPTPLFDEAGDPLPAEKNNGEWRADESGEHPEWRWEDSLSRDMLVGWAAAYAAAWEVIAADDEIPAELKGRLQQNAAATARALMKVGESGYDLEIPDADGRLTFHAYLNENSVDRLYIEGAENGFNATMALGIVGAMAYVAEDPDIDRYVHQTLVVQRQLPKVAAGEMLVNFGVASNFSNFNMAFTAMWLAQRYIDSPEAAPFLRLALETELWTKDGADPDRQPRDMAQSFFDVIYAAGKSGATAWAAGEEPVPQDALQRGLATLHAYPAAPYFDREVINCDAAEVAAQRCTLLDGTEVDLLGDAGRNEAEVARQLIPMAVRPPSNYHWRSDPYRYNGGADSGALMPAVDFRIAYWLGRFVRVAE